jgi:two-component sensor histidine kinase
VDFQATDSLGLQLVNALSEQLSGTIALERHNGTAFTLMFHT